MVPAVEWVAKIVSVMKMVAPFLKPDCDEDLHTCDKDPKTCAFATKACELRHSHAQGGMLAETLRAMSASERADARVDMKDAVNADLRNLIRDLALRRESHDRRQLYWALIKPRFSHRCVWKQLQDRYNLPTFTRWIVRRLAVWPRLVFLRISGRAVAKGRRRGDSPSFGKNDFVDFLPILLGAGAGSLYLNPSAKYSGELYRHELQTCLDGLSETGASKTPNAVKHGC